MNEITGKNKSILYGGIIEDLYNSFKRHFDCGQLRKMEHYKTKGKEFFKYCKQFIKFTKIEYNQALTDSVANQWAMGRYVDYHKELRLK